MATPQVPVPYASAQLNPEERHLLSQQEKNPGDYCALMGLVQPVGFGEATDPLSGRQYIVVQVAMFVPVDFMPLMKFSSMIDPGTGQPIANPKLATAISLQSPAPVLRLIVSRESLNAEVQADLAAQEIEAAKALRLAPLPVLVAPPEAL